MQVDLDFVCSYNQLNTPPHAISYHYILAVNSHVHIRDLLYQSRLGRDYRTAFSLVHGVEIVETITYCVQLHIVG